MDRANRRSIAITMGDPAGVGPEICLRALANKELAEDGPIVVVGNREILGRVAERVELAAPAGNDLRIIDVPMSDPAAVEPGAVRTECGAAALDAIELAVRECLDGRFAGMATCPIHKVAIHQAGCKFPGHTEMIASTCKTQRFAMMLYSPQIAVSFLTLHVALSTARRRLSIEHTIEVIELTASTLRRIHGREPRLVLLGFNPHAGEDGLFGDAEGDVLIPALESARASGIEIDGPLPPDTAFTPEALDRYDGHVCCYHDQGGIPFKMLSFADGVNLTMGLPIVRTSVDHGTAFDIAWTGKASAASLFAAVRLARLLSEERNRNRG